jgi:hypothetical protein
MFSYLDKFKNLPPNLKARVSGPVALGVIAELEKKYAVDLAPLVMKIMVKEIAMANLALRLSEEFQFDQTKAEALAREMRARIFAGLEEYLGFGTPGNQGIGTSGIVMRKENIIRSGPKLPSPPASSLQSSISKLPRSNFFFSADDEEEILKFAQKVTGGNNEADALINKKISEILDKVDIRFGSQVFLERFKQILKTYLKGIRERVDVKLTLAKSFNDGGLNLDPVAIDKIINLADQINPSSQIKTVAPARIKVPEDAMTGVTPNKAGSVIGGRDVPYDFKNLAKKDIALEKLDTAHELAPLTPTVAKSQEIKAVPVPTPSAVFNKPSAQAISKTIIPETKAATPETWKEVQAKPKTVDGIASVKPQFSAGPRSIAPAPRTDVRQRQASEPNGRIRMEDVKHVPRVLTPIDELKYFNLINFRRLDKDPLKAKDKIKEKIDILEAERYIKKIEGVQAWRQSPINKLYIQLGRESISQGKAVDVIIKERIARGEDTLSIEEFEAILQLNRILRY